MDTKTTTLSHRHLSAHTLDILQDCADGMSDAWSVTETEDGLLFDLPDGGTPHFPSDLADCVKAALAEGSRRILFTDATGPGNLKVYPES